MNKSTSQPERIKLTPIQIGASVILVILIILVEGLILNAYFSNKTATKDFQLSSSALTSAANMQREVLRLQVETERVLTGESEDFSLVDLQRGLLANQLRRAIAKENTDTESLLEIEKSLEEFDVLVEKIRANPTSEVFAEAYPEFADLFDIITRQQLKPFYDVQEANFYSVLSLFLNTQSTSQIVLLGASLLIIALVGGMFFSFSRTLRERLESKNIQVEELEKRVAERTQAAIQRTRALETSTEVSRRLSTILDADQLVKEVVEQLVTALDYYYAHIYLFEEDENTLVVKGGTGEAGQVLLARGHTIPKGRGLVGRAAERNEVVLVGDTLNEEGWLPNDLLPETKSECAVPIAIGDKVLGVFDVQHNIVDGITEEDVDLLEGLANQVAIAIQNAQAYTIAQRQAEREIRITEISAEIQQATTVDDVVKIAVSELGQTLEATRAIGQIGK